MSKKKSTTRNKKPARKTQSKHQPSQARPVHTWRICPYGEYWVTTHPLHIPPSGRHPEGSVVSRRGHCAKNPSGKDQLYPDEIREVSDQHFSNLKYRPCTLPLEFPNGSKYDDLIAGWVQYWNEVLHPSEAVADPLDPNLIKALIATESGFNPDLLANRKNQNSARGLMQIKNDTRKILGDEAGELKDHFITATRSELNNPSVNICAGVRWLFQKRTLASVHLKRPATWIEAIAEYKGASTASKKRAKELMDKFNKRYEALTKCGLVLRSVETLG